MTRIFARAAVSMIAVFVLSCAPPQSDQVTGGGSTTPLATRLLPCDTSCVILNDAFAFADARVRMDSAGSDIDLGTFTIAGEAGAELRLSLSADPAWTNALSDTAVVVVRIGDTKHNVRIKDLATVPAVFSLPTAGTLSINYSLRREFDAFPQNEQILLVQHLTNAHVSARHTPWIRPPRSHASLIDNCSFNAPGAWCSDTIAITPFHSSTAWTETGFQSQAGTGASVPITITFSEVVDGFDIDVYDPDFAGNQVVAYDADGVVVSVVNVQGDGIPGTLTVVPVSIMAIGIKSVQLVPAAGDYVAYDGASFTPAATHIKVVCTPNPVLRAQSATCHASPPAGVDSLSVSQWKFEATQFSGPVVEATASVDWSGTIVTAGKVTVTGTLDGTSAIGQANLQVTARDWSHDTVRFWNPEHMPDSLPIHPTILGQLGESEMDAREFIFDDVRAQVTSGPNNGAFYLTSVPVYGFDSIRINRAALDTGSDFFNLQPTHGAKSQCKQSDVVPFLPKVIAHEGITLADNSHAGVLRSLLNTRTPQPTEGVVSLGDLTLLDTRAATAAGPGIAAAMQSALDVDSGGTVPPVQVTCTFRYF